MLHVAPELCFLSRLKKQLGDNYLTADLSNKRAMVKMDITNIHYPDQSFDVIYCSHVLEHVQNDKRAMREFYRILKWSGWSIFLVPITVEKTFEDNSITDPKERLKFFGKEDHVRRYGPDFINRLREAGFTVDIFGLSDLNLNNDEIIRMGLTAATSNIYYCTKPCDNH